MIQLSQAECDIKTRLMRVVGRDWHGDEVIEKTYWLCTDPRSYYFRAAVDFQDWGIEDFCE